MQTRRQFLQLAGITLVGSQFSPSLQLVQSLVPDLPAEHGRALAALIVRARPTADAAPVRQLWPDSVTRVLEAGERWHRLPGGFAPRTDIQPMKPFMPAAAAADVPFWAEVAAPVASIRAHCAANAPLVSRVGHGGVVRITDFLPATPSSWYGIAAEDGSLLGWSQAVHWRRVDEVEAGSGGVSLELDIRSQRLTAWEHGRAILLASCSIGSDVRRGAYPVQARQIGGGRLRLDDQTDLYGIPWRVSFGDYSLSGAYWHNRFGEGIAGRSVQVTPVLAQWLYTMLGQQTSSIAVV